MIDRKKFFKVVRAKFGKLSQPQVNGFDCILSQWEMEEETDLRRLAYMLATCWHETARTMRPIAEYGKGKGRKYGRIVDGRVYYGRGFVQLTWDYNYKKMGKILQIPLYENPELALQLGYATEILFEGMLTRKSFKGDFTGRALENYFNQKTNDPIGARRIINGTDKAVLISSYHYKFLEAVS